jgi:hypothetical protein
MKTLRYYLTLRYFYFKILLDNNQLEQISDFVYLESQITEDAACEQDIKRRAGMASAMAG